MPERKCFSYIAFQSRTVYCVFQIKFLSVSITIRIVLLRQLDKSWKYVRSWLNSHFCYMFIKADIRMSLEKKIVKFQVQNTCSSWIHLWNYVRIFEQWILLFFIGRYKKYWQNALKKMFCINKNTETVYELR